MKRTIIITVIMLLTSVGVAYTTKTDDVPLMKQFSDFPMQMGEWQGTLHRFDDNIYRVLGVDDSVLANYRNAKGENIQLYVGFYKSQREGEIIHSPKNCMPGSGWDITETSIIDLDFRQPDGSPVKVIRLMLQNGVQRQVALYWYHSRGRVITSEYFQKFYLVWDAITRNRTDGSFVRLLSPVIESGESHTTETLKMFTENLFPILNEFIPT